VHGGNLEKEMKKVVDFIKGSFDELINKVSWPKYGELQSSAMLVLVATLIFALLVGVIDYLFKNGVSLIYENL
jgi:preprotein translocase subunit SecE